MIKYGYKQCDKCGNKENFNFKACGKLMNGDLFSDYVCKKCGSVIRVYKMEQKAGISMEISKLELENYKNRIERKIKRNNDKIKEYKDNKDNLSVHGYWSMGYYEGANSKLEDLLDDITDFQDKSK